MSLRAWKWVFGVTALLLFAVPAAYTWFTVVTAPREIWGWLNQLVATFFSVTFAFAVTGWFYAWQTGRARVDREVSLRAALLSAIFDSWDLLDDRNLQTIQLGEDSEAHVLLTFLQTATYEEALRSGAFGASETIIISRLVAIINVYNKMVERALPSIKAAQAKNVEDIDEPTRKHVRSEIDSVLSHREEIVKAGKNLLALWTLTDLKRATNEAKLEERSTPDPRVQQIIEDHAPKILPPSYKAGFQDKIDKAKRPRQ